MKKNKEYYKSLVPKFLTKSYELNRWLDSKVNDPEIRNKWENKYFIGYENTEKYYYIESDILAHDECYAEIINEYKKMGTAAAVEEIKSDPLLDHLNNIMVYSGINLLIPPNTNRYHANLLFNQMLDASNIVDPEIKEKFYEFCKEYTIS